MEKFFSIDGSIGSTLQLQLQEHISELCQLNVQERIEELRSKKGLMPDLSFGAMKEHILIQMKRLMPGSTSSSIGGILDETSQQVLTEAEDMAHILNVYWQEVFNKKTIDATLLGVWLSRISQRLPFTGSASEYSPTVSDVDEAIKQAGESAPGPDGIPSRVWKSLRSISAPLFQKVLLQLMTISPEELRAKSPHFNEAFLCCLGKKSIFTDVFGHVFTPSGTRPLSVVNSDNRILANAMRIRISPFLESWVSSAQRGFIKERYLLSNVVEIDWEAMKVSLRSARGAIILFDFQAAFPSVAHDYLWLTLETLGVPLPLLRRLRSFYVDNKHTIKIKGRTLPSITAMSGIRQGCPLSPIIFAVVVDVLLRRLAEVFPHDAVKAFADDIGMVVTNFDKAADRLASEFKEFGRISNLHLGMDKTIIIPLWDFNKSGFLVHLRDCFPTWSRAQIQPCGKYLGIMTGPWKATSSWGPALRKFVDRSLAWCRLPVGLFQGTRNYRTFVSSVLSFVQQIENVPDGVLAAESTALRKFTPGPGNWIQPVDLYNMNVLFGFPVAFPSLKVSAIASKLRVLAYEIKDADSMWSELWELLLDTPIPPLPKEWYDNCHVRVLLDARKLAASYGVTHKTIVEAIRSRAPHGSCQNLFIRSQYQQEAYKQLLKRGDWKLDAEERHRYKQKRWKLHLTPRMGGVRAASLFLRLGKLVRPRVLASILRTHWNGWCTRRRFQQEGCCVFRCSGTASDSIEHYPFCTIFRAFLENFLHMPRFESLQDFLLLDHRFWPDNRLSVAAIAIHSLYAAFNHARLSERQSASYWHDYMSRICYHAVMNHRSRNALSLAISNTRGWWK